jgi:putative membrane protein
VNRPPAASPSIKKSASPSFFKVSVWIGFLFGLLLFIGLIVYQDAGEVLAAVALAGWGLFLIFFVYLAVMAADAMSLRVLLPREVRPSFFRAIWIWWIGLAVNALLPVAQVGGELVRARLLARSGVPGPQAGAVVVAGLTGGVATLILFAAAGSVLLGAGWGMGWDGFMPRLFAGLTVLGGLIFGFYLAQRGGIFLRLAHGFERLAGGREWTGVIGGAEALDRAIVLLYREKGAFAACCLWRLAGWVTGVCEVWLALYLLGHPVSFAEAFVFESLGQAIRSAGFAIPGALGVQEGGFLVVGTMLGVPGEVALGVSLVKRVRDLIVGLPGLGAWQIAEGAGLFRGQS